MNDLTEVRDPTLARFWATQFAKEYVGLMIGDATRPGTPRTVTFGDLLHWFGHAMDAARIAHREPGTMPPSEAWRLLLDDSGGPRDGSRAWGHLVRAREIGQEEGRAEAIREIAEGSWQFAAPDASSEGLQESPSTPQAPPHQCSMRALRVHFMDGSHQVYGADRISKAGGWKVSRGTDSLVIGHGVPRIHLPLCNIKMWELVTEDDL